jgi:hypothetical protein
MIFISTNWLTLDFTVATDKITDFIIRDNRCITCAIRAIHG